MKRKIIKILLIAIVLAIMAKILVINFFECIEILNSIRI